MFTDDQDIGRELKAALNVEPSTGFEARVRRRVEEDRPTRRRGVPTWLAAAAAVIVLAGAWFAMMREATPESGTPDIVASRPSPAPRQPDASSGDRSSPPAEARATGRASRGESLPTVVEGGAPAKRREPEILVPAGQLALIQRLLREANSGRVELPGDVGAPAAPAELVIPAMTIEPIPQAGAEPSGGASQGPKGLQ